MSKQLLAKVLAMIPKLTLTERERVAAHIRLLGYKREITQIDQVEQVYVAVARQLHGGFPSLKQLKALPMWWRFERGCRRVQEFINNTCPDCGRLRPKVVSVLVGCVLENLRGQGLGTGPVWVGDRMYRIDEVVDNAFPGYVESGILSRALLGKLEVDNETAE